MSKMERLIAERDAARAEVERLKAMLPPTAHTGVRNGPGEGSWSVFAEKVVEERDAAQAEVERLTVERDTARAEVRRLIAERDQPESRGKGREVGRFGLDGHYLYAMEPARPSDEDIWREAFMVLLRNYYPEIADAKADSVLALYRKRWPR